MDAMNCPRCKKVFVRRSSPICDDCVKDEEQIFEKVREYVKDNPDKSINDVSEECEVSVKKILQYLRDGKLEARAGMQGDLKCSKCGKPIISGRMCEKCILETNFTVQDMRNAAGMKTSPSVRSRGQMFTKK